MLCSVLGMVMMASARDLVSIFVALELLSIPAYMLAAWNKRERRSTRPASSTTCWACSPSAVMLYGMSLLFGVTGIDVAHRHRRRSLRRRPHRPRGRGGRVRDLSASRSRSRAVPFHQWAPDTYEGAPTPVTAFFSRRVEVGRFRGADDADLHRVPRRRRRLRAAGVGDGRTHDDGRQRPGAAPDQHRAHARLLLDQPGRIHADAAGVRRQLRGHRLGDERRHRLPARLRLHEPRCVRHRHRRDAQDPQRRDLVVRRPVRVRPRPRRGDDDLLRLAGRHPAARWLVRQVQRLQGRARRRHHRRRTCSQRSPRSTP